jgi:long-chain acyl-CoA synthetase
MERMKAEAPLPKAAVSPSDVAMIIYTSGTTGNPKGVELTNANLKSVVTGGSHIFGKYLNASNRSLAFLPWAHVYGMSSELNSFIYHGSSLAIVPTRDQILEGIALAQPNIIVSVPALFNRIFDGVQKSLRAESPLKQKLVAHALSVARARNHELEYGRAVGFVQEKYFQLMDKVVLSKIRGKFGKLEYFFAGGAATSLPVLHFFEDVGIPVLEGYGLTETSPIITASGPDWNTRRLGCVGVAIDGCTVRIADPEGNELPEGTDGEVTCSGPNVMLR